MSKTPSIIVKSIKDVSKFEADQTFFYKKAYITKSDKTEEFTYWDWAGKKSVCISKKAPSLITSFINDENTIGIFESYWPIKYGLNKTQTIKLGHAFKDIRKSNDKWMAAFNAVDLLQKDIQIMLADTNFKNSLEERPIKVIFQSLESDTSSITIMFADDTFTIDYDIHANSNATGDDDNRADFEDKFDVVKYTNIKSAFKSILTAFEQGGYDLNKITINVESYNSDFKTDLPDLYSWTHISNQDTESNLPFSAIKSYKSLYEKTFPNIKFPEAYSFSVENGFGTKCSGVYLGKNKHDAYRSFVEQNKFDGILKDTPWFSAIWNLSKESDGVKEW